MQSDTIHPLDDTDDTLDIAIVRSLSDQSNVIYYNHIIGSYEGYSIISGTNNTMYGYDRNAELKKAGLLIAARWKGIMARRRLFRLRIGNEIQNLPDIGIKYFEARDRFKINASNDHQMS